MIASNHYEGKGNVKGRDSVSQFDGKKKAKNIKKDSKYALNKKKKKKKNSDEDDDEKLDNDNDNDISDSDNIKQTGLDSEGCGKLIERRDEIFSSLHSVAKLSKAKLGM